MESQTKRYKSQVQEQTKERQLSGLFNIISNNLEVATEVLSHDYKILAVDELSLLSKKARSLSEELNSQDVSLTDEELVGRVSSLKHRMMELIIDLSEELTKQISEGNPNKKAVQSIVVARRLLRDSRRGLATIQD